MGRSQIIDPRAFEKVAFDTSQVTKGLWNLKGHTIWNFIDL